MKITSGTLKGRLLNTPKDNLIRPTSDKIRQAIFNALRSRISFEGLIVLDACAGTGALGLESLSNGSTTIIFMDSNPSHLNLAKQNVAEVDCSDRALFLKSDVTKLSTRPETIPVIDLCFLDPPYNKNIIPKALQSLKDNNWIHETTLFVIESERNFSLDCTIEFEREYGDTKIIMLWGKDIL
jgi:16S rRNA (guanine966-N2)-methyltransferase